MSWMDVVIVLLLIGALLQGYRKGLIKEASALLGVIVALYLAWRFSSELSESLAGVIPLPESLSGGVWGLLPLEQAIYTLLAFVLIFVVVRILLSVVASVLTQLFRVPVLAQINGVGGAVLGLLKVLLVILVVVNLLATLPWESGQTAVQQSTLSQSLLELTPELGSQAETKDPS
ncbi:CvpA family protein [Desmospora profundinema]|uniref:Membrane protein required for colicin V production n=1 Tax=Desmospora profundinema TaxID=1571184 RepID=A0ABU1IQU6_9BACL|nr:CvpA family protein [Desmospora profundinema]MDR6226524.1 putative membrane protein required for colicin V production [Desmospora profundinema]